MFVKLTDPAGKPFYVNPSLVASVSIEKDYFNWEQPENEDEYYDGPGVDRTTLRMADGDSYVSGLTLKETIDELTR